MGFVIRGIDPQLFASWFALADHELAARDARRVLADSRPGYPCRVSLVDAAPGEELLLVPFEHHPVCSPYRSAGAIYIRRAARMRVVVDQVPAVLDTRVASVRGYDAAGMLVTAELAHGRELAPTLERVLAQGPTEYVHVHYAKPGCFAFRADRR